MKKKPYTKLLLKKESSLLLVFSCFLFSFSLQAQSFTNNPNVSIKEGTIVTETKISIITEQRLFIVKGTTISGIDDSSIVYVENKSRLKKEVNKQRLKIVTNRPGTNKINVKIKKGHGSFILNTTTSDGTLFIYQIKLNCGINVNVNHYSKNAIIRQYYVGYVRSQNLKHQANSNKNSFRHFLFTTNYRARPPPLIC